ncbi:Aste57867_1497 [Aphanomyces stellatus]|uniref:Aste57867_1497 protein n=1 Tax=Aphanomyces stellatus TaxID=120398 RepID=A0A485K7Z5_9STRA|nr:hypothetical protein As57867_001496 [Aphanomyces stellatus]VFT78713.1 Aste57867_1497 [Aphanomyces stellatus]
MAPSAHHETVGPTCPLPAPLHSATSTKASVSETLERARKTNSTDYLKQFQYKAKGNVPASHTPEANESCTNDGPVRCIFTPDQVRLFNDGKEVNELGNPMDPKDNSSGDIHGFQSAVDQKIHIEEEKQKSKKGTFKFFDHLHAQRRIIHLEENLNADILKDLPSPEQSSELSQSSQHSEFSAIESQRPLCAVALDFTQLSSEKNNYPCKDVSQSTALFFSPHGRHQTPLSSEDGEWLESTSKHLKTTWPYPHMHPVVQGHTKRPQTLSPEVASSPKRFKLTHPQSKSFLMTAIEVTWS